MQTRVATRSICSHRNRVNEKQLSGYTIFTLDTVTPTAHGLALLYRHRTRTSSCCRVMLRIATHSICLCHDHMAQNQPHGITIGTLDAVVMDSLPQDYASVQADPVFEAITGVQ